MPPKLHLPDVALCAIDTINVPLTIRAMRHCLELCDFGDAVLLTDADVEAPFRIEKIKPFAGREAYSNFACKHVGYFSRAPFVLMVQWDGYVLHPAAWRKDFLDYDYIGAQWPQHKDGMAVGNGGFSLRSRKLLNLLASPAMASPQGHLEDDYICRIMRPVLERDHGIRFAPVDVADVFSYERSVPSQPTFGFHGFFNMWRHMDDSAMEAMVGQLGDYIITSREYVETLAHYASMRKFKPLRAFYSRLRQGRSAEDIRAHFLKIIGNAQVADEIAALCESAVG